MGYFILCVTQDSTNGLVQLSHVLFFICYRKSCNVNLTVIESEIPQNIMKYV